MPQYNQTEIQELPRHLTAPRFEKEVYPTSVQWLRRTTYNNYVKIILPKKDEIEAFLKIRSKKCWTFDYETKVSNTHNLDPDFADSYRYAQKDDHLAAIRRMYAWKKREKRKRNPFRHNLLIKVRSRHDPLRQNCPPAEMTARLLLRDMLSEKEWRRYVTNGFLMVKGQSNRFYQIFADGRRTVVYENGRQTHTLCVHTASECPPTDHVLNLKAMVEIDESLVWKASNVHNLGIVVAA